MGGNKLKDGILLLVVVSLAVLILLPDSGTKEEKRVADTVPVSADEPVSNVDEDSEKAQGTRDPTRSTRDTRPIDGVPHPDFPLVAGTTWVYRVDGPDCFVSDDAWQMKLNNVPEGDSPGLLEVGFGDERRDAHVWRSGDLIWLDALPLLEPVEFLGNFPASVSGVFLPAEVQIGTDAVWTMDLTREVVYQYRDKRGKLHSIPATAIERERAMAREQESITTAAGHFLAWKISWISRIEITANGRPVLKDLTSEPYRRETMWIAPGVGVVRRRIEYSGYRGAQVSFELVEFSHPVKPGQ